MTRALPNDSFVPVQSERFKGTQDVIRGVCDDAWRIEIFDAHQPCPVMGARVDVTADSGHQRTEMQRTRRRRCESPAIARLDMLWHGLGHDFHTS